MQEINSTQDFTQLLNDETAVLAYFSHDNCNVCKVLKPKLSEAFTTQFPKVKQVYVNVERSPELAGQYNIFTVPVVVIFLEGKESMRKSRSFGITEVSEYMQRPYSILFE